MIEEDVNPLEDKLTFEILDILDEYKLTSKATKIKVLDRVLNTIEMKQGHHWREFTNDCK